MHYNFLELHKTLICLGYEAWRHAQLGSWFIRTMVYVFQRRAHRQHVLDMLTEVRIALWFCYICLLETAGRHLITVIIIINKNNNNSQICTVPYVKLYCTVEMVWWSIMWVNLIMKQSCLIDGLTYFYKTLCQYRLLSFTCAVVNK